MKGATSYMISSLILVPVILGLFRRKRILAKMSPVLGKRGPIELPFVGKLEWIVSKLSRNPLSLSELWALAEKAPELGCSSKREFRLLFHHLRLRERRRIHGRQIHGEFVWSVSE